MPPRREHIRDLFTPPSRFRYLLWRIFGRRWDTRLRLREGLDILVRAAPKTDYWVVLQVFYTREYRSPFPLPGSGIHRVLDLGANVGYSLLHWARLLPEAEITGYEPVAVHCQRAREQLRLNGLPETRVRVREAAVGVRAATAYIIDRGADSTITPEPAPGAVPVAVVDLFEEAAAGSVDLLKMDIEGGEYELIGDERFGRLGARYVVMEWHEWKDRPERTKAWLTERLEGYGYQVRDTTAPIQVGENLRVGMLWASRA